METSVEDEGFEAINGFRELEELNIDATMLSPNAALQISPHLPLRQLSLDVRQLSAESTTHLAKFKTLQELTSRKLCRGRETPGPAIDDALLPLAGAHQLEHLDVSGSIIVGPGLDAIRRLPNLRFLGLCWTKAPSQHLTKLVELTQLETLLLSGTGLDDAAMEVLASLIGLRHLAVTSTAITDRSVPAILGLRELRALGFENVHVSREAAERLFELPKLEELEIWIENVEDDHWYSFIQDRPGFHLEA